MTGSIPGSTRQNRVDPGIHPAESDPSRDPPGRIRSSASALWLNYLLHRTGRTDAAHGAAADAGDLAALRGQVPGRVPHLGFLVEPATADVPGPGRDPERPGRG